MTGSSCQTTCFQTTAVPAGVGQAPSQQKSCGTCSSFRRPARVSLSAQPVYCSYLGNEELILLSDLRVVITMRSANLRSFSGHAAFPGGKADTLEESPFEIARREASEEIGLPQNDSKIPSPFRIEHICHLPFSLARNAIAVRPCVAFLHNDSLGHADVQNDMIPRLDAREVAAVFSAPFHNFLKLEHEFREGDILPKDPVDWYEGSWQEW